MNQSEYHWEDDLVILQNEFNLQEYFRSLNENVRFIISQLQSTREKISVQFEKVMSKLQYERLQRSCYRQPNTMMNEISNFCADTSHSPSKLKEIPKFCVGTFHPPVHPTSDQMFEHRSKLRKMASSYRRLNTIPKDNVDGHVNKGTFRPIFWSSTDIEREIIQQVKEEELQNKTGEQERRTEDESEMSFKNGSCFTDNFLHTPSNDIIGDNYSCCEYNIGYFNDLNVSEYSPEEYDEFHPVTQLYYLCLEKGGDYKIEYTFEKLDLKSNQDHQDEFCCKIQIGNKFEYISPYFKDKEMAKKWVAKYAYDKLMAIFEKEEEELFSNL